MNTDLQLKSICHEFELTSILFKNNYKIYKIKNTEHPQGMFFIDFVTLNPSTTVASQVDYSQLHISNLYFPSGTV